MGIFCAKPDSHFSRETVYDSFDLDGNSVLLWPIYKDHSVDSNDYWSCNLVGEVDKSFICRIITEDGSHVFDVEDAWCWAQLL